MELGSGRSWKDLGESVSESLKSLEETLRTILMAFEKAADEGVRGNKENITENRKKGVPVMKWQEVEQHCHL